MDNSVIVKSGWLIRQTSILKKWKKNWVELYHDGHLKYYDNDQSPNAEDVMYMPTDCVAINIGAKQVEGVQSPKGFPAECLFSVVSTSGNAWIFCGENVDDMRAWQLALEQARLSGMQQHPQNMQYVPNNFAQPQPGPSVSTNQMIYPQQYYGYPQQPGYIAGQPQHTTVIYQQHPSMGYYGGMYPYYGTNMALGMMTGAALGSMMWSPCWW